MNSPAKFRHEDVSRIPRGWRVRTITEPSGHRVRLAFPPGPRKRGAGKVVSILHPAAENPTGCRINPQDLGKARLVTQGGGLFGFGKRKEYWQTEQVGKTYQVRKTTKSKKHKLPIHVSVDTATGAVTANPRHKAKTREQVEKMQQKAVRFLRDVVKDRKKADEIAALSVEEYAAKKKIQLQNPAPNAIPDESAEATKVYEGFHQEPVREVLEFQKETVARKDYAVLGDLEALYLRDVGIKLYFENEGVLVASNAGRTQIYFIGGNQDLSDALDRENLKTDASKDFIDMGRVDRIDYDARKGFNNFQPTIWHHAFGENGHKKPRLMYDALNQQMVLVGGEYEVKDEGIVN